MTEAPKYTYEDFIKVSEELKKEGYTDEQIAQAVDFAEYLAKGKNVL